uniref:MYND-type domain-containing protein n=1 Tax=Skeletonema marinoi TaxID=267567 RepID=A0A7S2Q118_9STRA|mmetsp:Transcript_760/g.1214  ORF Transcript_760/g.1214 Transcript_760/m.1214 type:complete len:375 (+) Transcript_760:51-1175(+)
MDDSATTLRSLKVLNLGDDIAADEAANGGGIANWAVWKSEAGNESDGALDTTKETVASSDDEEEEEETNVADVSSDDKELNDSIDAGNNCAECGKAGDDLKICSSCRSAKYCSRECQLKAWAGHKQECKKRSAEHEEALFKTPPPRPDCPICFIPLPIDITQCQYQGCCSKHLCTGCIQAHWMISDELDCPFCRVVATEDDKEYVKRIEKRAATNDAEAIQFLAGLYTDGKKGLKQDHVKAMQLYMKAGKLGSALAYRNVGAAFHDGRGVKKNAAKEKYYHELAAIGGYMNSRHVLGEMEWNTRNFQRACKHYAIGADAGHSGCLSDLQDGVKVGAFDRNEYARVLQSYKKSVEESRSDQRENSPLKQLMFMLG